MVKDGKEFKFRRHDIVGSNDAESDGDWLEECFYEVGDLDVLRNPERGERVVVGRTGSGKSALLMKLLDVEEHAVEVKPESLSLQYLSNLTIVRYLESESVSLDMFYKLLWRHAFIVELCKAKWNIRDDGDKARWLEMIREKLTGDRRKLDALSYLDEWGDKFWLDTDEHIKEVTDTLQRRVAAKAGLSLKALRAGIEADQMKKSETKTIVRDAQEIVSAIQMKKLNRIMSLMEEDWFADRQPRYYLLIDGLDERWVDDQIRFKLIRALLEAVRDFRKIPGVKIVVALRRDLLDHVNRMTRGPGQQEEKLKSQMLDLRWNERQLIGLLDLRVGKLIRERYTKTQVGWKDVVPVKVGKVPIREYWIGRTMLRPRDMIDLFNCCIAASEGKAKISAQALRKAEKQYARNRLKALQDEWILDYPELLGLIPMLKGCPQTFRVGDLNPKSVEDVALEIACAEGHATGDIAKWALRTVEESSAASLESKATILYVLYRVGLVGLKPVPHDPMHFAFGDGGPVAMAEITEQTSVGIWPGCFAALGTRPN